MHRIVESKLHRALIALATSVVLVTVGVVAYSAAQRANDLNVYRPLSAQEHARCDAAATVVEACHRKNREDLARDAPKNPYVCEATSLRELGHSLYARCSQTAPGPLSSYIKGYVKGETWLAVAGLFVGVFVLLTALNMLLHERSRGWQRLAVVLGILVPFSAAAIVLANADEIYAEILFLSLLVAFGGFVCVVFGVLGGRSVYAWIADGFLTDSAGTASLSKMRREAPLATAAAGQPTPVTTPAVLPQADSKLPNIKPPTVDDYELRGVGGWLALLVFILMIVTPLVAIGGLNSGLDEAIRLNPLLASHAHWNTYKTVAWSVVLMSAALSFTAGYRLWRIHEPGSVRFAIGALWITGPVSFLMLGLAVVVLEPSAVAFGQLSLSASES